VIAAPLYRLEIALVDDGRTEQFVIADENGLLHVASSWLAFMSDDNRSPNTIKNYGRRVAWYLSWMAQTADWRGPSLAHFGMWRRTLTTSAVIKTNGETSVRAPKTVDLWMTPLVSFYLWADAEGLLTNDIASRLTQIRYFAAGTAGGGEHGRSRRVLVKELRSGRRQATAPPQWISSAEAREKLLDLDLNKRDRFLVDLLYWTGIRVGEAQTLFREDMHFGGGSPELDCNQVDPHLHVGANVVTETDAEAKSGPRTLFVNERLVEGYIDYLMQRTQVLAGFDHSPHVFVNLFSNDDSKGRAMTYSGVRKLIMRCGKRIDFPMSGPHILRHTFATRMIRGVDRDPVPIEVVQELMGHASLDSTRIYLHDGEAAARAALEHVLPRTIRLGPDS